MKALKLFITLLAIVCALPGYAVSDKDMEQAKVIAAKLYLRWTNNGSGYLDDLSAKSMADLESKLKAKEKENIVAFKAVAIPKDYASWDHAKFVEFWGSTFFSSPGLSDQGRRAKDRVKAQVKAIKTAAPSSATPSEATEPEVAPVPDLPSPVEISESSAPNTAQDSTEARLTEQMNATSEAIASEVENSAVSPRKARSNTWVYIAILAVLVGVVIWLMVYAANMMKKQGGDATDAPRGGSGADDGKVRDLTNRLAIAQQQNSSQISEIAELKHKLEAATTEIRNLRQQLATAQHSQTPQPAPAPKPSPAPKPKPEPKPEPKILTDIYLGRANAKGLFVRGDRRPNPEHTIYHLDTKDGMVGTFVIAETPEAIRLACSNPFQYLVGGCNSDNFEDAENASRIVTETPGTAMFENGCWKVLRKAHIRFE